MSMHLKIQKFAPGQHAVKGIPFKAHKINGFTPELLEHHFEQVYGLAVRRLNEIEIQIANGGLDAGLRAEQTATLNAIVLHELHFSSLGEEGGESLADAALEHAIAASFGSVAAWQADFGSMATSSHGGWIVLAWSKRCGRLMNIHLSEQSPALIAADPVLVIDVGQHAYFADFGTDKQAYVTAFLQSVHWARVAERFHQAFLATPEDAGLSAHEISVVDLKGLIDGAEDVLVLDVRHDDDCARYKSRIAGTVWRDSFDVAGWAKELPKDKPVVVYCMYGFWVSQKAAEELRALGINAQSLAGGVTAWRAMGYSSDTYAE